jgi:transcriptional regulator with XRE-family HTH domain
VIAATAMTTLGQTIKNLRGSHALTQEDLAARAGLAVATIYRAEHGAAVSADTIASIAAALGVDASALTTAEQIADDQPYLPITQITGGRTLISLLRAASRLDFGFAELGSLDQATEVEALHGFCTRLIGDSEPATPILITTRELEAKTLLTRLERHGFVVSGGTFDITAYEVDEEDGAGIGVCYGQWDECCAVLRVGLGEPISRAYVLDALGKYETPKGDSVIFPPRDVLGEWNEYFDSLSSRKEA